MTDPVNTQKVVQQVAEQAAQTQDTAKPKAAEDGDVARFEQAMSDQPDPGTTGGPETVAETKPVFKSDVPESLGDSILQGVEKLKESHDDQVQKIKEIVDKSQNEPMSLQDAMKLQFELMQLNLQQEATAKTADKSSQGIQTLFKPQ